MSVASSYESRLVAELTSGLHERLTEATARGRDLTSWGTPADLARRMLAAVPLATVWDDQLGPFYDTAGLTRYLGVSKQALADRVRRRRLLAMTTADGKVVYPACQFDGRDLVAGLADTLSLFRDVPVDGWVVGAWLTTPASDLSAAAPLEWLRAGKDQSAVARLAQQQAARWSL